MSRYLPFIEASVEGKTVSAAFYQRLNSVTIVDAAGQDSDTCELVFDDAGNEISVPEKGAKIAVKFGFRDSGVWKMGTFVFEKAIFSFGQQGQLLTFSCKSADMRADVKEPLSEHFDDTTIGALVAELAGRHGYGSKVSPELASIKVDYLARSEQSAVDFLTRLADRSGALFSVKDNKFLFLTRGQLAAVTIDKSDCSDGSLTIEPRPKFGKVSVGWYDRAANQTLFEEIETGLEGPVKRLRTTFKSADEARRAARSEGDRLGRATGSGSLTLAGRPEIMADTPIMVTGMRAEVDGEWRVSSVEHRYDDSYTTTIQLEAPESGKK